MYIHECVCFLSWMSDNASSDGPYLIAPISCSRGEMSTKADVLEAPTIHVHFGEGNRIPSPQQDVS